MRSKWDITDDERAKRDAEILRLYNLETEMWSMTRLAEKFGTSLSNVSRIVNRSQGRYWATIPKQKCPYL